MTGGAIEADGYCTIVNVLTAVIPGPAVNTDTGVATDGVEACSAIVTGVGLHETLIDILSTVLPCPFWWTLAIIGIDSVNTYSSIHALVTRTVIHIILTVVTLKTWEAGTLVGMVTGLSAGSSIKALRWGTGQGGHLARSPAVSRLALTAEGPKGVNAEASIEAHARLAALVNVVAAVLSLEARWAGTVVVVIPIDTTGPIGTWTCSTGID